MLRDVERRTASGERHDVIDGQVGGSVGGTLVARAPVAVLATPGAEHAGAESLPGPRAVQGVVPAAVRLAGVLGAATTRAAGDDTTDRAQLHPQIVDGLAGAVYSPAVLRLRNYVTPNPSRIRDARDEDLGLDLECASGARLAAMRGITIGEAAQRTGLSVDTLRYYERAGLIDPVRRARNGRRYDEVDLLWLAFLRRLRASGMPIAQMRRFARLRCAGDATARERRELLEEHAHTIRDRLAELSENLEIVERKITHFRRLDEASRSKPTVTPREPRPRRAATDQAATAERAR